MTRLLAVVLLVAASGCLQADPSPEGPPGAWRVSGSFTANATQEEMNGLAQEIEARHGAEVLLMESFPVQYQVRPLTEEACANVRALLQETPFVASVGACVRITASDEPETPTWRDRPG